MLLRTKRGRCEAPRLRPRKGSPLSRTKSAFAFTTPLGLEHPVARAHVKLLGPCFKTGRRGRRTTRDRDATRTSNGCSIYEAAQIPAPAKARNPGLPRPKSQKLHPGPRSGKSSSSRETAVECSHEPAQPRRGVLADRQHHGRRGLSLNHSRQLREPLRLLLHSFTYS